MKDFSVDLEINLLLAKIEIISKCVNDWTKEVSSQTKFQEAKWISKTIVFDLNSGGVNCLPEILCLFKQNSLIHIWGLQKCSILKIEKWREIVTSLHTFSKEKSIPNCSENLLFFQNNVIKNAFYRMIERCNNVLKMNKYNIYFSHATMYFAEHYYVPR